VQRERRETGNLEGIQRQMVRTAKGLEMSYVREVKRTQDITCRKRETWWLPASTYRVPNLAHNLFPLPRMDLLKTDRLLVDVNCRETSFNSV
jgi:hypothetical protein